MVNRREFIKMSAAAGISIPFAIENKRFWQMVGDKDIVLTEEALRIHKSAIVVDGHNDLPNKMREKGISSFDTFNLMQYQPEFQTDIPRLRKGGVGAQFWVADGGTIPGKGSGKSAPGCCLEDIGLIYRMADKYPADFEMAFSASDIFRIHEKGKIACLIGIEGGFAIENSLNVLDSYYRLGARYLTLTLGSTNEWVDSATDEAIHGGLASFGEKVVCEMNRLGMLVDISHVSAEAMRDVLQVSQSPVIASHSSAFALANTPRNLPDDVLQGIAKNGGVAMVNFFPGYLTPEGAKVAQVFWDYRHELEKDPDLDDNEIFKRINTWVEQHPISGCSVQNVADHIDYIVKTSGLDHVGLGSDFDGFPSGPEYLNDVSYYPYLTQVLLNRGYKEDAIRKILGGNFIRVFQEAEQKAGNF
jgi:membrane dipeptidase